jgi:hypothetical protein
MTRGVAGTSSAEEEGISTALIAKGGRAGAGISPDRGRWRR